MQSVKDIVKVNWPNIDITDNFSFATVHPDGVFKFTFRYFNDRWNGWCELPGGEVRTVGVTPNVPSWSGFIDYGVIFETDLTEINKSALFDTNLYILTWD